MKIIKISVVLPCRNEEQSIGICINKIKEVFLKEKINGEIIVSDNKSIDNSAKIAKELGAKVVYSNKIGYGYACLDALKKVNGKYIILADADNSYDFYEIPKFIKELDDGFDFVIGNRFKGKMEKKSMYLVRKIGNHILSNFLNILFNTGIYDTHCGFRGIKKGVLNKLKLESGGMEFASEMVIKAKSLNLKIKEIPINYYPRIGESKLNSIRDGFRHLKFILSYKVR